jgi:hypothetical protein
MSGALSSRRIVAGIRLGPSRACTVGEPRATPKGSPLSGVRSESYCAFYLGERHDGELAIFFRDAMARLEPAAAFIDDLRRTGGRLNCFISWSVGDHGEILMSACWPAWPASELLSASTR